MRNNLIQSKRSSKSVFSFTVLNWIMIIGAVALFGNKLDAQEKSEIDAETKIPMVKMDLAPPNVHEKHVYVNEEKFIFWPRDKPIFFWLGTSSDEKAQLFPILHSGTMTLEELENYRSDGLKLEISSNQYVRWLHHFNKKETTMHFLADGVPPVSQLKLVSTKRLMDMRGGFFSGDAIATVTATDSFSGVEQTYLSVNGKQFLPSVGIRFPEEGYYLLRHYAVDRVGNTSEPLQVSFYIDKSPPVTRLKMTMSSNNIFGPHSILSLPSQDALSGVHETYYQWNSGLFKKSLNNSISFEGLEEGTNVLQFYTKDLVGNTEGIHKVTLRFDPNGPEVSHDIRGDQHLEGGKVYLSSRSQILLKAVDDLVDIQSIEYHVNGLSYGNYKILFRPPVQSGEFKIGYQGIDVIGNKSILVSASFIVDSQSPSTRLITDGATYKRGPNVIWVNSKTRISLIAEDDLSGVQSIFYKIDENEELLYKGSFTISAEGRHTFEYSSVDHVNNKEVLTPVLIVVDDTPPEIRAAFNRSAIGSEGGEGKDKINVYPLFTTLFLNADDNSAKLKEIRFSINGRQKVVYQEALLLENPGNYSIEFEAEDNLGNISKNKIIFIIKAD